MRSVKFVDNELEKKMTDPMMKKEKFERKSRTRRVKRRSELVQIRVKELYEDWWTRGGRRKQK